MYSILLLALMSGLLFFSNQIKLETTPVKENAYELKMIHEFKDPNGFYSRTSVSKNENGFFALLDAGNKRVNIYNKDGKFIKEFGSEGNGPGEWSNPFKVFTTKNRIYVRDDMKVTIHDFNGNHIKDLSLISGGTAGTPLVAQGKLIMTFEGNTIEKMKQFDEDGNPISSVKNESYIRPEGDGDETRVMIRIGFRLWPIENGYLRSNDGQYNLEVLDQNFKVVKTYTRDFERIPRDFQEIMKNMRIDVDDPKEKARLMAGMESRLKAQLGKYKDDVGSVMGQFDNAYFLGLASDGSNTISIDVIKDDKLFTQLELKERDSVEEFRIENGTLIVNFKNNEEGPFARAYSIVKN